MDDYYHGTGVVIDGRDLDIGYGALKFFFFLLSYGLFSANNGLNLGPFSTGKWLGIVLHLEPIEC